MEVGLFLHFNQRPDTSQAQAFEDCFAEAELAEEVGLDSLWLGEVHFAPDVSVLAAPVTIASAIAARTKRIRIGTSVLVLPLGNPLRLAEEVATIDHISQGRFDLGIGRSGTPRPYNGYNIPYTESLGRYRESLEVILKAWTQERFSYDGEFYSYHDVCVVPKPYQKPHPPIHVAATSPDTFIKMGRMGFAISIALLAVPVAMKERIESYRRAWNEAGHGGEPGISTRLSVYVAETAQKAYSEPEASTMAFYQRIASQITQPPPGLPEEVRRERVARGERLRTITYDELLETGDAINGTPEAVVDRLQEIKEEFGLTRIEAEFGLGGRIPHERILNSIRLFADKVMPKLK